MPTQAGVSPPAAPAAITVEELAALIAERDALAGALRVATTERDLALERLKALQRQLFAALGTDQTPPAETDEEDSTPVRLFAYAPGRGAVHAEKLYAGTRSILISSPGLSSGLPVGINLPFARNGIRNQPAA